MLVKVIFHCYFKIGTELGMATGLIGSDICKIRTRTRKFSLNPNPIRIRLDLKNKTRTRSNGFRIGSGFIQTRISARRRDSRCSACESECQGRRAARPGRFRRCWRWTLGTPAWSPELVTRQRWSGDSWSEVLLVAIEKTWPLIVIWSIRTRVCVYRLCGSLFCLLRFVRDWARGVWDFEL